MRFISKIRNYSHGIRDEESEFVAAAGGRMQKRITLRGLEAQFEGRGLTAYEQEVAIRELTHKGLPEDRDTRVDVSPLSRLSVYDSEKAQRELGFSDEEREIIEQTLLNSLENGKAYVHVPTPARPEPWPGYDTLSAEQIIDGLNTGLVQVELDDVIAYERENENRIEILEALSADPVIEETIVQL